jgi:dolichyl-phosphate beta-glucosyltransferase
MPELSIVIPCYNEEKRISKTLLQNIEFLNEKNIDFEIITVDDGSADDSVQVIEKIPNVKIVKHEKNQGKGAAVKAGVINSTGDFILFADADNSTPIEELEKFWRKRHDYDILIGSRYLPESDIKIKQPWHRNIVTFLGNKMIRIILGLKYKDTQCGFKLFKKNIAKELFSMQTIDRWGFDIEILYLAKKKKYSVKEIPVSWINSPDSKVKSFDFLKTFGELLKIKFTKY